MQKLKFRPTSIELILMVKDWRRLLFPVILYIYVWMCSLDLVQKIIKITSFAVYGDSKSDSTLYVSDSVYMKL